MPPAIPLLKLPFLAELTALRRDIHAQTDGRAGRRNQEER